MLLIENFKGKTGIGFRLKDLGYWTGNEKPVWYHGCVKLTKEVLSETGWVQIGSEYLVGWYD